MESTTTILDDPAHEARDVLPAAGWLDVCHVGVALRALVSVHLVVAIGAMFVTLGVAEWLTQVAVASALVTPATLAWLLATCSLRRWGGLWSQRWQGAAAVALGAACAMGAAWPLRWLGGEPPGSGIAAPVAGAAFAAVFVYWLRTRARMQLPAQAAAQLQELQARIRPHFLFNTLNTAIALVRSDPGRAEDVLEDLADLFRVALVDDGVPSTLGAEIEIARRYLEIEQLRFGDRLRVRWTLDPAADLARLPPLLLQPLVENAVRHGIEPCEQGGDIHIRTTTQGDRAMIRVINTVHGAGSVPGHGIGLGSMQRRLALMHDVQARFSAGVRKTGEFRVDIAVPLEA